MIGIAATAFAKPVSEMPATGQNAPADAISYSFGVVLGAQFSDSGLSFDYDDFVKGFKDAVEGTLTLSEDEALFIANSAYKAALDKQNEESKERETVFLAKNAQEDGVITTNSGLQYRVIQEGTGAKPLATDTVWAHYKGSLLDGTMFDSSYDDGEPVAFSLYEVIDGWAEGLQLMSVGSKYELFVPSTLAYGADGAGSIIPPYATLLFEVELVAIMEPEENEEETTPQTPDGNPDSSE
ncbi:MAG: FKBP-type peptidyl-prolyl cis-trans isomerase [Treponema sp.]|nr:FKBP-type peptidyl-prolyl cis-trans isomerase [Treponema sp.]